VRAPEGHAPLPSPLAQLNRSLARPIAFLFGALGFAFDLAEDLAAAFFEGLLL